MFNILLFDNVSHGARSVLFVFMSLYNNTDVMTLLSPFQCGLYTISGVATLVGEQLSFCSINFKLKFIWISFSPFLAPPWCSFSSYISFQSLPPTSLTLSPRPPYFTPPHPINLTLKLLLLLPSCNMDTTVFSLSLCFYAFGVTSSIRLGSHSVNITSYAIYAGLTKALPPFFSSDSKSIGLTTGFIF